MPSKIIWDILVSENSVLFWTAFQTICLILCTVTEMCPSFLMHNATDSDAVILHFTLSSSHLDEWLWMVPHIVIHANSAFFKATTICLNINIVCSITKGHICIEWLFNYLINAVFFGTAESTLSEYLKRWPESQGERKVLKHQTCYTARVGEFAHGQDQS